MSWPVCQRQISTLVAAEGGCGFFRTYCECTKPAWITHVDSNTSAPLESVLTGSKFDPQLVILQARTRLRTQTQTKLAVHHSHTLPLPHSWHFEIQLPAKRPCPGKDILNKPPKLGPALGTRDKTCQLLVLCPIPSYAAQCQGACASSHFSH